MEQIAHPAGQDRSSATRDLPRSRTRRRLSRTFSAARWREYGDLLRAAADRGYAVVSLEEWLLAPERWDGRRTLLLRHDVDQHPSSALRVARIERDAGVSSTWYFRWRTAHSEVIAELRRQGGSIGLHYETLSRQALERGEFPESELPRLIEGARHVLRGEIDAFAQRYGDIRSVCPHGDSRVPGVSNADLLLGEDWSTYGIQFDAHLAMRRHTLGAWLTDRSAAEGRWGGGRDPYRLLDDGLSPILLLVHPNNWVSGPSLWRDRVLAACLPTPRHEPRAAARLIRTGDDRPPI